MQTFYDDIRRSMTDEGQPPTIEENISCFQRIVEGSDAAIDEFILSNMRLVSGVVSRFIKIYPKSRYLADDMFCEGLLAFTRSIKILAQTLRKNPEKVDNLGEMWREEDNGFNVVIYLFIAIYRDVQRCYELDSSETISERMQERHTPPGRKYPTRKIDISDEYFERTSCDTFSVTYLMEDILGICHTEEDEFILKSGLTLMDNREVAQHLGISVTTLRRRKKCLYGRFCTQQEIPLIPPSRGDEI